MKPILLLSSGGHDYYLRITNAPTYYNISGDEYFLIERVHGNTLLGWVRVKADIYFDTEYITFKVDYDRALEKAQQYIILR